MNYRASIMGVLVSAFMALTGHATPVIDPIANVTIPAGKSLIIPITATNSSGQPLTYTITSSTNAIAVVMHTNNPFWQLTVARAATNTAPGAYQTPFRGSLATVTNVGKMTFMLFPEYAPHTVNVFQSLTYSGFYNSNTIFHRVISGFMIQGGDPATNGSGGLVFQYNDEFNPEAIFSGNGQLALANSGKNTDGSQFFITIAPYRAGDFDYTIFGQLVRGLAVLTNLNSAAVNTNDRPLANQIIQTATYVTNTSDTVLTLTATNISGIKATISVIVSDNAGNRVTNTFTATTATDAASNNNPFINTQFMATNFVGPANQTLTNFFSATELDNDPLYWYLFLGPNTPGNAISGTYNQSNSLLQTLTYNLKNTNGLIQLFLSPATNYSGPISIYFDVSDIDTSEFEQGQWSLYAEYGYSLPPFDEQLYTFAFGDTPIYGQSNVVTALAGVPFTNLVLATFTNGVPYEPATNFSAYVNWGDDSTNTATVASDATGIKAVLGSHSYSYPGIYPIYVQVQSGIGASATIISSVNVISPSAASTDALTVQISGEGTVTPSYTSAPLTDGQSYSVSATPASQWLFVNWTDSNGFVLGTGTNLTFTMSPGFFVTANFTLAVQPITVQVSGQGTLSPNYNGQSLTVGSNYSMIASPAYAWQFTNWTDIHGLTVSASTNLTFTMAPSLSLTANFIPDEPLLLFAGPSNGQVITNNYASAVTITGTAGDHSSIASVWYQVNSGGWQQATGTTNWSFAFTPNYGVTNLLQAYAVNNFGNASPTNALSAFYLPGSYLNVATNGLGTITPALNNQLLPLGSNYVLTATPATGFTFAGWTGSLSSSTTSLSFTMTSNLSLTATFADATAPKLAITNLISGQQVTSNTFTLRGTASDTNWQVATVFYSLNGGARVAANSTNGWTNWFAPLILPAGTNTVTAYAVDPNSQPSPTNTVSFQSLATNQLQVTTVGRGAISPNYSNAWLQIGRNYTVTATAASSFAFTNWTLLTNGLGSGVTTNNATVQFMMVSNLMLQATFAETAKPTLTISYPTSTQHLTNALPTVIGTASDVWGVSNVLYSLNGGVWTLANSTNVWTNWFTTIEMGAGSNNFRAYAQNLGGNFSTTNTINVLSSNAFLLKLNFLTANPLTTNGLNLGLLLSTGLVGHVQFSTNLIDWASLTNFNGTNSPLHLVDPAATNSPHRYYRAVIP